MMLTPTASRIRLPRRIGTDALPPIRGPSPVTVSATPRASSSRSHSPGRIPRPPPRPDRAARLHRPFRSLLLARRFLAARLGCFLFWIARLCALAGILRHPAFYDGRSRDEAADDVPPAYQGRDGHKIRAKVAADPRARDPDTFAAGCTSLAEIPTRRRAALPCFPRIRREAEDQLSIAARLHQLRLMASCCDSPGWPMPVMSRSSGPLHHSRAAFA